MIILEALFFIIPTYVANGMANVIRVFPIIKRWNTPIDFGRSYKGKRILGDGKTFRGFVGGTFFALIGGYVQYFISQKYEFTHVSFYNEASLLKVIALAGLMGFGALVGDAVKSFFKRRVGITRGRPWPPFDQLDFIVGGVLLGAPIYFPGWTIVLILLIITPVIHLVSNITAYLLKIKDVWW